MKTQILITVSLLIFTSNLFSQTSCLPEGIAFYSQEQIDNFQINYPGCTEIEGYVTIFGDDINNLQGLDVLTSIGGFVSIIWNNSLTSLTGLEGLTSIGGDLSIHDNYSLPSLIGLENIAPGSIENISIFNNPNLSVCNIQTLCNYMADRKSVV